MDELETKMNTPLLYTERLVLRRFTGENLEALYRIYSDEEVNRFLPWFPVKTRREAELLFAEQYEKPYAPPFGYRYAVCLKEDNLPVGYLHVGGADSFDFGYGLHRDFWHRGIITEAGRAVIDRLRQDGIPYITATHDVNNPKSGAVMKRLGMKYQYSYEEQWQPKNFLVTFRMYQLNLDERKDRVYTHYWDTSRVHFIEPGI